MAQKRIVEGNDAIALAVLCKKRGLKPPLGYETKEKFGNEFVQNAGGIKNALIALKEALESTAFTAVLSELTTKPFCELTPAKRGKAQLHTWLAWKKEPGKPFGQAMDANYFDITKPVVREFLDWFSGTFELSP